MLLQNGAFDQAVTKFRKVVSRDPGNFEARFNLAFAYLNWQRYGKAVEEFKNTLGINPNCGECWSNLAIAYEAQGQSENALQALHQAVQYNPSSIDARTNLATMYANMDRLEQAVAQYEEVIQMDGSNVEAHLNAAKCLIQLERFTRAKHHLRSVLALNPRDADAHWELGNIYWMKDENVKEAISEYKKAIEYQPNSQLFYENLALLYESIGETEDAIKTWRAYLIYLDDALRKEKIRERVQRLEKGESPSGAIEPAALFGDQGGTENITRLQDELRYEPEGTGGGKIIPSGQVDFMSDLEDLEEDSDNAFEFDMEKAVEQKKKENEESE
jgi:tetratricopeptide (TPR) repeat protein